MGCGQWLRRVSHDLKTMAKYAYKRVNRGLPMPGVWLIPDWMQTGQVIEEVRTIVECSLEGEWEGCVRYLPLS